MFIGSPKGPLDSNHEFNGFSVHNLGVNKVVDISSTIDRKIEAVKAHGGMIRDPQILVDLREANRQLGEMNKMGYVEMFHFIGLGNPDGYVLKNAKPK